MKESRKDLANEVIIDIKIISEGNLLMINLKSKSFWYTVVGVLITPVILNTTLFQFTTDITYKGDWLSFWGNYSGGLISALVAYIVANSQITKQLNLDLARDKYYRTVNQLPALVRLKLELEKFIRELTRVKNEREKYLEIVGGIMGKPHEQSLEEFFEVSNGIEEFKVTEKHYRIEFAEPEAFRYLEQVENVDLHVDLITAFNFYKEFSSALLFNIEIADSREHEILESLMSLGNVTADQREQRELLRQQTSNAYIQKKNGWITFYEDNILEKFNDILTRLDDEIKLVKDKKENGDTTLNGNKQQNRLLERGPN